LSQLIVDAVVAGYFGYGNVGDEIILKLFLENFPFNTLVLKRTGKNPFKLFFILLKNKKASLIFPGGEIFQDRTSFFSLISYATLVWIALFFKRRVFLLFQGFSDNLSSLSFKIVKKIFSKATFVSFRDLSSFPSQLKLDNIRCSPDISFLIKSKIYKSEEKIVLCVIKKPSFCLEKRFKKFFYEEIRRSFSDYKIIFIPFHPADENFVKNFPNSRKVTSVDETLNLISKASFIITSRYHAMVLSFIFKKRVVGIDFDGRLKKLSDYAEAGTVIDFKSFMNNPSLLHQAIEKEKINKIFYKNFLFKKMVNKCFREFLSVFKGG